MHEGTGRLNSTEGHDWRASLVHTHFLFFRTLPPTISPPPHPQPASPVAHARQYACASADALACPRMVPPCRNDFDGTCGADDPEAGPQAQRGGTGGAQPGGGMQPGGAAQPGGGMLPGGAAKPAMGSSLEACMKTLRPEEARGGVVCPQHPRMGVVCPQHPRGGVVCTQHPRGGVVCPQHPRGGVVCTQHPRA
eukprot:365661-Chlamydomonas_euryale.AAC.86